MGNCHCDFLFGFADADEIELHERFTVEDFKLVKEVDTAVFVHSFLWLGSDLVLHFLSSLCFSFLPFGSPREAQGVRQKKKAAFHGVKGEDSNDKAVTGLRLSA